MSSNKHMPPDEVDRRIIKKYPNRRLYDTKLSSYIALSEYGVADLRPTLIVEYYNVPPPAGAVYTIR